MKTQEELNTLKEEIETLNKKLAELTEEEIAQAFGGIANGRPYWTGRKSTVNRNKGAASDPADS